MSNAAAMILTGLDRGLSGYLKGSEIKRNRLRQDKADGQKTDLFDRQLAEYDDNKLINKNTLEQQGIDRGRLNQSNKDADAYTDAIKLAYETANSEEGLNKGSYFELISQAAYKSGDQKKIAEAGKLMKSAQKEGFNDLGNALRMGQDPAEAIKRFNRQGKYKIGEDAILVDGKLAWMDGEREMFLNLSDIQAMGSKASSKKRFSVSKFGKLDEFSGALTPIQGGGEKDTFTDKKGNPRSIGKLISMFKADNPEKSEDELSLMADEDRAKYYKSRKNGFSKWANNILASDIDGGVDASRTNRINQRKAAINEELLTTGDVKGYAERLNIPEPQAQQIYQRLREDSGIDDPSDMGAAFSEIEAARARPELGGAGRKNMNMARSVQKVRDFVVGFKGDVPSIEELETALTIAQGRSDQDLIKRIEFVIQEVSGNTGDRR